MVNNVPQAIRALYPEAVLSPVANGKPGCVVVAQGFDAKTGASIWKIPVWDEATLGPKPDPLEILRRAETTEAKKIADAGEERADWADAQKRALEILREHRNATPETTNGNAVAWALLQVLTPAAPEEFDRWAGGPKAAAPAPVETKPDNLEKAAPITADPPAGLS